MKTTLSEIAAGTSAYEIYTTAHDVEIPGRMHVKERSGYIPMGQLHYIRSLSGYNDVALSSAAKQADIDPDVSISVLCDLSGSQREAPIQRLFPFLDAGIELSKKGHGVEVIGHTTPHWKGGLPREEWLRDGRPVSPGRLNALLHLSFAEYGTPARRRDQDALAEMCFNRGYGYFKENIDGEALLMAADRLNAQVQAKKKILLHISDLAPVDDSTLSVNPADYLSDHYRHACEVIRVHSDITLMHMYGPFAQQKRYGYDAPFASALPYAVRVDENAIQSSTMKTGKAKGYCALFEAMSRFASEGLEEQGCERYQEGPIEIIGLDY